MRFSTLVFTIFAGAAVTLSACNQEPESIYFEAETPQAQLGDNVIPTGYTLDLRVDPQADNLSGTVTINVDIKEPTQRIWLHGKNMIVGEVTLETGRKRFVGVFTEIDASQAPSGVARIDFEKVVPAGKATLTLPYETPYNLSLNSAYKVERGEEAYIVTQMEPVGAREAFPGFDEPKFKVPFNVSISSPSENVVYFNTPAATEAVNEDGWTRYNFETTRPLPTYLIAFGAGPYDVVDFGDIPANEIRTRPLRLRGLAAKGSGPRLQYALENTEGILTALEGYFGTEYPYEKLDLIAAPEYAFGAMENPGAIVYREYLLLLDDDAPLSQKRAYARVHSHELAHQWFGNLVTPVWWEDIWLNEAFATWMGNKGIDLWQPEGGYDRVTLNASLGAMTTDSLFTTRKVREPLARTENVMDQFDGITYRKGGGVLSMFESYLGEDKFKAGVRLHMDRYKDGVATGDNFFQSIADGSGNPEVVPAMKSFVDQPGLPLVKGALHCSGEGDAVTNTVSLTQSRYAPLGSKTGQGQSWHIPVCAKFGYADGTTLKTCTLMKDSEAVLATEKPGCADWVMLNENGAGYYRFSLDDAGWQALLANSDQLNERETLAMLDSLEAGFRAGDVNSSVFVTGMKTLAAHPEYDIANKAGNYLGWMYDNLAEDSRPAVAKLTRDMYAERYRSTVGTDTTDGNLLAPDLAARLVSYGDDRAMQAGFAGQGAAYLGLDGEPNKSAIAPNLLSRALRAVMIARGDEAYAPLLEMANSGSAFEKGAAIGALGSTTDPAIAAKLRDLALNDTEAMTGRQATSLLSVMMGNDAIKDETWAWFQANFDAFISTRVADVRKPGMPGFAPGCSVEAASAATTFFTSKAAIIPGYERSLAQTVERIELCAALKEAKAEEMAQALAGRK
ncbi:M1 family metallopeptidase [Robiginitomaculum antarcticum]|uniref:M1 family metallopeptidase n=1 Tax=Robiginitomaculum antarcticum TaxID=437507 RepID=UPI0003A9055E|nr:M1 family metallopeptidase [Robiginitomaculum antarcticum]